MKAMLGLVILVSSCLVPEKGARVVPRNHAIIRSHLCPGRGEIDEILTVGVLSPALYAF